MSPLDGWKNKEVKGYAMPFKKRSFHVFIGNSSQYVITFLKCVMIWNLWIERNEKIFKD
jgi:hypothetical protein